MGFDRGTAAPTVAVVGAGFSGLLTAIHLLRGDPPVRVLLVERAPPFGPGRAYGTSNPLHLLNVRASNMSAFPDRPDHFLSWLGTSDGDAFVRRGLYGDYLQSLLEAQLGDEDSAGRLTHVAGEAVAATPDESGWRVQLACGRSAAADAVVLAVGFLPSALPDGVVSGNVPSDACVIDPWSADLTQLPQGDVLLLGSGLTMVDVALSLARSGRRLTALSRRGLLSLSHAPTASAPGPVGDLTSPRAALSILRAHARAVGWREAVDSVRPHAKAIWSSWNLTERRRFLRHLRPWWDIHRHRMAQDVAERVRALQARGGLELQAGRLESVRRIEGGVEATIRLRGSRKSTPRRFAALVNCASLQSDPRQAGAGLIADLLRQGLLRADTLALGVEVDADFGLIGDGGGPSPGLFAVGPLTRGAVWEAVAVPDLRGQAQAVAGTVLAYLGRRGEAGPPGPASPPRAAGESRAAKPRTLSPDMLLRRELSERLSPPCGDRPRGWAGPSG